MNVRWHKVERDLRSNRSRTFLVVLAIAVGVVAFGGVFATKEILLKDMAAQYTAIHPASVTMYLPDGFDDGLVAWAKSRPDVAAARGSRVATVRLYTPNGSRNLNVTAADWSNDTVNRVIPEAGTWPPQRKEIFLERTTAALLAEKAGDEIEIELPNGEKRRLFIAGTVHDYQAIPANMFPELSGYVSFSTLTALGLGDQYTRLEIMTAPEITTKDDAEAVGEDLKTRLEQRGFTRVSFQHTQPGKHWGQDQTNAFVTILTVVGSFSLILSVFLVVNTITAVVAQQKKQIGIMKAVGGTNRQLMTLYLVMAAAYGGLAFLLAVPLGALLARANLTLVTGFLNLDATRLTVPLRVIGLEGATAIGVPLLAAALPVMAGMRVTVREALSDLTTGSRTNSLIDRITRWATWLSRPTLLSLRNTFRKKTRLALTLITLTVAGTLFMSVSSVQTGMMLELNNMMSLYQYDLELYFDEPYNSGMVLRDALKAEGVVAAETPKYGSGRLVNDDGSEGPRLDLFGLNPESAFMEPKITAGRWLVPGDQNKLVIASQLVRDNPELQVGREVTLTINEQDRKFEIVGIYLLPGAQLALMNDEYLGTFLPDSDQVSSVRVKTAATAGPALIELAKRLEQDLKQSGYNVAYSLTVDTIRSSSIGQFNFLIYFLYMMAALVAVVGGLGLAGTMSLNVLERTREIGVMRSIGAGNGSIRSLVTTESVLTGFISWLIALPLSIPVGFGFGYAVGKAFFEKPLNFTFPLTGAGVWLMVVTVIAALASLAPANRAAKLTIRETLAYE